jgi:hypothetical protein
MTDCLLNCLLNCLGIISLNLCLRVGLSWQVDVEMMEEEKGIFVTYMRREG